MAEHNEVGKWGEDVACGLLIAQGATIRERNWRRNHHEIDIIASKDDMFIFVEVKTRTNPDEDPLEAIDSRKISCIARAAAAYLATTDVPASARFDVVAIRGTKENYSVEHIEDAFYPPLFTYR